MGIENPVHLLFIAVVALVVLGPKRLPGLARALGHGIREFREAIGQGESEEEPQERSHAVDPPEPVRSPDAPDRGPL
jgi:sec-independent protein translocase protein TatA